MHRKLVVIPLIILMLAATASAAEKPKRTDATFTDFSGTYSFLREGELVEVNLQEGRIIGDVQRFGTNDSDRGILLTHFFEKASLNKDRLTFSTKVVHGMRYEFNGRVERGEGKSRAEEDYYRIVGTLTEYTQDASKKKVSARKREVTFKSSPDEMLTDVAAGDK